MLRMSLHRMVKSCSIDWIMVHINNFCDMKGMMPPIIETLDAVAQSQGVVWSKKMAELKKNKQFHVEVY